MSNRWAVELGDCLDLLRCLPDNSIDSCVTDPPYELWSGKSGGKGFMGKSWDGTGIAFSVDLWREVLRVVKPGAHILVAGIGRTHHRTMVAIEDAGFEIRDCIYHLFGCLSEDTEILTEDGWEFYHEGILEKSVLCYLPNSGGQFVFDKPVKGYLYENKHPAYHIESDKTDQLVSRNHRCLVERDGRETFVFAETLQREETLPILESLSDLPESIPDLHKGTSYKKQDLLKLCEGNEGQVEQRKIQDAKCNLQKLWQGISTALRSYKKGSLLFAPLQWKNKSKASGKVFWEHERQTAQGQKVWSIKSRMEGRRDLFQEAWQLQANQICLLSAGVYNDGSERRVCYGTSVADGETFRSHLTSLRGCSPQRPRPSEQRYGQPCALPIQQGTQTTRRTRAKVEEVEYTGKVWCVQVSTGAFVTRRNGKIFITGNSGFPKSLDISKAIDKAAGAEREVIGKVIAKGGENLNKLSRGGMGDSEEAKGCGAYGQGAKQVDIEIPLTSPATPEAKQWSGWGTGLKPACEIWVLAQKPFEGAKCSELHSLYGWDYWYVKNESKIEGERCEELAEKYERIPLEEITKDGERRRWLLETTKIALRPDLTSEFWLRDQMGICLEEKWPYTDKTIETIAADVLKHGCGGINIDGCRVEHAEDLTTTPREGGLDSREQGWGFKRVARDNKGRFPANVVLSHSELDENGQCFGGFFGIIPVYIFGDRRFDISLPIEEILSFTQMLLSYGDRCNKICNNPSPHVFEFYRSEGKLLGASSGVLVDEVLYALSLSKFLCYQDGYQSCRDFCDALLHCIEDVSLSSPQRLYDVLSVVYQFLFSLVSSRNCREICLLSNDDGVLQNNRMHDRPENSISDGNSVNEKSDDTEGILYQEFVLAISNSIGESKNFSIGKQRKAFDRMNISVAARIFCSVCVDLAYRHFLSNNLNIMKSFELVKLDSCPVRMLDEQSGVSVTKLDLRNGGVQDTRKQGWRFKRAPSGLSDSGTASRFFYCSKSSPSERDYGLNGQKNKHPTVKPLKLMEYLCRLITPPNGLILDPFCGSGTTGIAAVLEGFRFIGFDSDPESIALSTQRIEAWETAKLENKLPKGYQ